MENEKQSVFVDDHEETTRNFSLLSWPLSCLGLNRDFRPSNYEDISADMDFSNFSDEQDEDLSKLTLPYHSSNKSSLPGMGDPNKLTHLRKLMMKHNIAVYIIPSEDEHQSEYTADADKRREFISGFTGSAGVAIVTLDEVVKLKGSGSDDIQLVGSAALLTDGRYFLQAERQLDPDYWTLLKQGIPSYPKWTQYCLNKALDSKFSNVISCDPRVISLSTGQFFDRACHSQYLGKVSFKPILTNLVDEIWSEKPARSLDPVFVYDMQYAGESVNDKLARVRDSMDGTHLVVTALDEVAWLLNLRCLTDVEFCPVFFSYVIVTHDTVVLYIDERKLASDEVKQHLDSIDGLEVKNYNHFYKDLTGLKATVDNPDISLILPSKMATTYAIVSSLPQSIAKNQVSYNPIVAYMKLYKNKTELKNAQIAQDRDSLVFIIYAAWLEDQLINKKKIINEYEAACKIHDIRSRFSSFLYESYETISSSGANAAVIHYAPSKEENSLIDPAQIYLIDSGAQYLEGTTDITRTYKFGYEGLKAEDKKYYTLVLKGHLAVALAKFPPNNALTGAILDSYSRQPLWNEGLDFNHGSGHGIGACGNVHEGPLYLLTTSGGPSQESLFKPGAITTIEPGYYIDGEKGFRVESEIEVVECDEGVGKTRQGWNFLGFKYLTKVPFCRKLISRGYLSPVEIQWINEFHKSIRDEFGDQLLDLGEYKAFKWLMNETKPI